MTGSVSRGVADDVSDIELLIVTRDALSLEECFTLASACGLADLGTWGQQGVPTVTEPDPRRAVRVMTKLQADTVALAPDWPNIVRARKWLDDALEILSRRRRRARVAART